MRILSINFFEDFDTIMTAPSLCAFIAANQNFDVCVFNEFNKNDDADEFSDSFDAIENICRRYPHNKISVCFRVTDTDTPYLCCNVIYHINQKPTL